MDPGGDVGEPVEPVHLDGGGVLTVPAPSRRGSGKWWWAGGATVVLAGAVIAGVLLTGSEDVRGEATARLAAQRFVAALNAGDKNAAADESCANFANEARSVAGSGADPDIDFTLDAVTVQGAGSGSALLVQHLHFAGSTQDEPHIVRLEETGGKWLVCGDG